MVLPHCGSSWAPGLNRGAATSGWAGKGVGRATGVEVRTSVTRLDDHLEDLNSSPG